MFSQALMLVALLGTVSSTVFLALALVAATRHKRELRSRADTSVPVPVSVLKPLHGMEPRLRENIESFFQQDHPDFELLFCARHDDDPALQLVREISAGYPTVTCRTFTSGEPPWPNAKVWSLQKLVEAARQNIYVISDSDVCVSREYLRRVSAPFSEEA